MGQALCSALYVDSLSIFLLTLAASSLPRTLSCGFSPEISSPRKLYEPRQTGVVGAIGAAACRGGEMLSVG